MTYLVRKRLIKRLTKCERRVLALAWTMRMSSGWTVCRATAPPPATPPLATAPNGLRPPAVRTLVANPPMMTNVPTRVTSIPLKFRVDATVMARRSRLADWMRFVLPRSRRLDNRAPPQVQNMLAKLTPHQESRVKANPKIGWAHPYMMRNM